MKTDWELNMKKTISVIKISVEAYNRLVALGYKVHFIAPTRKKVA